MTRRNTLIWIAVVLLVVAAFVWALRPQPVLVEVAEVRRAHFELTIDEDGRTRVRERYLVSAPLAGRLARIALRPGDEVRAGAPLATLWPALPGLLDARTRRELDERVGAAAARLAQARAHVAREEAALAQAKNEVARQRKLRGEGFVSPAALDQAELALRVQTQALEAARFAREGAEHDLAQARAALTRAQGGEARAGAWTIASPVDGRVLRVLQESEAVVALGTPLLEVGDPRDLEVVVDLLSGDAARIAAGARVHVEVAGAQLAGRVRRIEPSAFTKVSALGVEEQRVNAIVDLDPPLPPAPRLGDGFRVDLRIVALEQADAVVAPVAALFRAPGAAADEASVFVVRDGRTELRAVKVGARGPLQAWIASGLAPGEVVVVFPGDRLAAGDRVRAVRGP